MTFKFYCIICLLILLLFLTPVSFLQAAQSYIVGTVSVTPLKIELSARSWVFVNKKFNLKATIANVGQSAINDINLTLALPASLTLINGELEQNFSSLEPNKKQIIKWQFEATSKGSHIIQLTGSGIEQDSGQLITAVTSLTIKAKKQRFYHLIWQSWQTLLERLINI